jgi:hypothetical protein
MNPTIRATAVLTIAAAGLLPASGALAQWYSSYPQTPAYGYGVQQPYAVEVSPNTYVIHRPSKARAHARTVDPCVDCDQPTSEPRHATHADPALIDELVKRHAKHKGANSGSISTEVVNTKKIVRNKPVVIEHEHVVDDPPRVIERRHITEDAPGRGLLHPRREVGEEDVVIQPGGSQSERPGKGKHVVHEAIIEKAGKTKEGGTRRVIRAEAEVTILGPDRMSIRLFRKGHGDDANAEAQ